MNKPKRLIYITSGLHNQSDGAGSLEDMTWKSRNWNGYKAYSDTKFQNVLLAKAVARHWPDVYSNAVTPGWVATKMGGASAPEDLKKGPETQAWLAGTEDADGKVSGKLFKHMAQIQPNKDSLNEGVQEKYLRECEKISGVKVPW